MRNHIMKAVGLLMALSLCGCGDIVWPGELDHQKRQMEKLPIESVWESQLMSAYGKTRPSFLRIIPNSRWDRHPTASGTFECTLTGIRDPSGLIGIEGTQATTFLIFGKSYTLAEYPKLSQTVKKYFGELGFHTSYELRGFLQMQGPGASQLILQNSYQASIELKTGCHLKSKANSNAPATAN